METASRRPPPPPPPKITTTIGEDQIRGLNLILYSIQSKRANVLVVCLQFVNGTLIKKPEAVLRKKVNTSNKEIIKGAPSFNADAYTHLVPIYVKKQNTVSATHYWVKQGHRVMRGWSLKILY